MFAALAVLLSSACLQPAREIAGLDCDPEGNCAEGFVCHQGLCVSPDALVDAAGPDRWSGSDLAGFDSTAPDAAAPDAAAPDAAAHDAFAPDAAQPDSTAPDAPSADAAGAVCGNGVVEQGEDCDPGPLYGAPGFYGCSDCVKAADAICIGTPQYCTRTADVINVPAVLSSINAAILANPLGVTIFVSAEHVEDAHVHLTSGNFVIAGAPGASIITDSTFDVIEVHGDASLTLIGMHISSTSAVGPIDLTEVGEQASLSILFCDLGPSTGHCVDANDNDGAQVMHTLWSRIHDCAQGGIDIETQATYNVRHNFIYGNGIPGADGVGTDFGGVTIKQGTGTFAFNSVVGNLARDSTSGGVKCSSSTTTLRDSIVTGNSIENVDTDCNAHSQRNLIPDGPWAGLVPGDPSFINPPTDLHIDIDSAARDQGLVTDAEDGWDIDGQLRPLGLAPDVGADEAG